MDTKDKEYSFSERLEWMMQARTLLDQAFYPKIAYQGQWVYLGGSQGSILIQRQSHIDVALQLKKNDMLNSQVKLQSGPNSVLIDEKIDSKNRDTLFCETTSMREFKKPGWMVKGISKADILLWAFPRKRPLGLSVNMLWLPNLIDWFWPRVNSFLEFSIPNREGTKKWITLGRQVYLSSIPDNIFIVRDHLVKVQIEMSLF